MSFHPIIRVGERHRSQRVTPPRGEPFTFTPERRAELEEICSHYPPERRASAILAALYLVQAQQRYVTGAAMEHVAEVIGCSAADVEDVVSFYTMFYTTPVGRCIIQVCRTLSCALAGAERVTEALSEKLRLQPGETDAAREFTLMEVECLGACDRAPVIMVNDEHWHERADPDAMDRFIEDLRARGPAAISGCYLDVETV